MRVMVMVKASKSSEAGEMPSQELLTAMGNFNEELVKAGIMLAGEGLKPSSEGKRVLFSGKDRIVRDGPFAETKELIAGFWIWRVNSMEEAIEWVKRCPNPMPEDSEIEIRPVFEADDFGETFTPELREQEASLRAEVLGLGPIRYEDGPELRIAGVNKSYTRENDAGIPDQWAQFMPRIGKIDGQVGTTAYGVSWNFKEGCAFDYLTGVEVANGAKLPADFSEVKLPPRRYAVFTHSKHVSKLSEAMETIGMQWAPDCGLKIAMVPCFQRYTSEFNPSTGMGGMEIWVPLES